MKNMRFTLLSIVFLSSVFAADDVGVTVSGPFTQKNLTIFFVHGTDQLETKDFLSLERALRTGLLVISGTADQTHRLEVANRSSRRPVYLQAGQILKGGTQDRAIAIDSLVAPDTEKLHVLSYCVEKERSFPRGTEDPMRLSSSRFLLPTSSLMVAAQYWGDQGQVWREISEFQKRISRRVRTPVPAEISPTSLQLSLENKQLRARVRNFMDPLLSLRCDADVVGMACAIDGALAKVDIFGSHHLFEMMKTGLFQAAATEAIAQRKRKTNPAVPKKEGVVQLLKQAAEGKVYDDRRAGWATVRSSATLKVAKFESMYLDRRLHLGILAF